MKFFTIELLKDGEAVQIWPGACEDHEDMENVQDAQNEADARKEFQRYTDLGEYCDYLDLLEDHSTHWESTTGLILWPMMLTEYNSEDKSTTILEKLSIDVLLEGEPLTNITIQGNQLIADDQDGREWIWFEDRESAIDSAREDLYDRAQANPRAVAEEIGIDTVIGWGFEIGSFDEYLANLEPEKIYSPEHEYESTVQGVSYHLYQELGFIPTVAYQYQ